jgi:hypothetical protein
MCYILIDLLILYTFSMQIYKLTVIHIFFTFQQLVYIIVIVAFFSFKYLMLFLVQCQNMVKS